jgi:hypothetical protein
MVSDPEQVDCSVERRLLERRFFAFESRGAFIGSGYAPHNDARQVARRHFPKPTRVDLWFDGDADVTGTAPLKGETRQNALKKASLKRHVRFI